MLPSNRVDDSDEDANESGVQPCPHCGSLHRWVDEVGDGRIIVCDACGHNERVDEENSTYD